MLSCCHVMSCCRVMSCCHVMSCCNVKSCCQNQRILRVSPGNQNQLVLLVLQKKSNTRKPQNVGKSEFLPLRLKNQRGCFWSTLRAKTWHVAQLGHIKWEKVSFQAVFHLLVIVKHPKSVLPLICVQNFNIVLTKSPFIQHRFNTLINKFSHFS